MAYNTSGEILLFGGCMLYYQDHFEDNSALQVIRFELIYKNILVSPEVQNYPQNDPDNIAYTPQIVEFLLTYYMPLLPLWSGIILRTVNSGGRAGFGPVNRLTADRVGQWLQIIVVG